MNYIFRRIIFSYGWNDGDIIEENGGMLLDYTSDPNKALSIKDKYQYKFYQNLEINKQLTEKNYEDIIDYFKADTNRYNFHRKLEEMSFSDFKNLENILGFDFITIRTISPNENSYYPLINHSQFSEFGIDTTYNYMYDDWPPLLKSKSKDEAIEKAVFYLLMTNWLSDYMGDLNKIDDKYEFLDSYYESRHKMLNYFSKSKFFRKKVPKSLITKYDTIKFYFPQLGIRCSKEQFQNFPENKKKILGEYLEFFNSWVDLFKSKKYDLIKIINFC